MTIAIKRHPQSFGSSKLKNEYRGILDQAKVDGAVVVRDQGDDNLYIVREDIFGALEAARDEAQDFAQFVAAVEEAISKKVPIRALSLGRLSWAADLSQESFRLFVTDYITGFFRAVNSGDWGPLRQLVLEWRDTAAVEADPVLMLRIGDVGDIDENVDIGRPIPSE